MHDPCTLAFDFKYPWMRDANGYICLRIPFSNEKRFIRLFGSKKKDETPYFPPLLTIWHRDPEKDGSDDSCGRFMRLRHCDKSIYEKIKNDFEFQWNHGVPEPWFNKQGNPNYSTISIGIGMFRIAANHVFGHWSKAGTKFLNNNIFNILSFCENSCDSLYTIINQPYGREEDSERIANAAACVYTWIMRAKRPWYKHPNWHFWHWEFQWYPLQKLRRYLFSRCCICGKGFKWNETACGAYWESPKKRWFEFYRSERNITHIDCSEKHCSTIDIIDLSPNEKN